MKCLKITNGEDLMSLLRLCGFMDLFSGYERETREGVAGVVKPFTVLGKEGQL